MVIIPTDTQLATYEFSVELEAAVYRFRFQFNERDKSWFFDVLTEDGTPIRQGIKAVTNFPLLRQIAKPERPPGELYCVDTTGEDKRAGLGELGVDRQVRFVYLDQSEVPDPLFG